MSPTVTVKGYDANNAQLATDTHTFNYEAPPEPLTGWQSVLTACDPNIDTNEYLYDDNHYIIRYVALYSSTFTAQVIVHEFYCYGSASSFITSFGNTNMLDAYGTEMAPFIKGAESLFNQSISTGYAKWAFAHANIHHHFMARGHVGNAAESRISDHMLDEPTTTSSNKLMGGSNSNYRDYVHPEACSTGNRMDVWYQNAVISKGGDISAGVADPPAVINNGATANHLNIINNLTFGSIPSSMTSGVDNLVEEISIYPIKNDV